MPWPTPLPFVLVSATRLSPLKMATSWPHSLGCWLLLGAIFVASSRAELSPLPLTVLGHMSISPASTPIIAVPNAGGFFFIYDGASITKVTLPTPTIAGTLSLSTPFIASLAPGTVRYQPDMDILFVCSGSAVGIMDPASLSPPTAIWNSPTGSSVTACSAETPGVLWVAVRLPESPYLAQLFIIRPSGADLYEPWLQGSGQYLFPDNILLPMDLEVLPDGTGFFEAAGFLYTFLAIPDPVSIPLASAQAMPSAWHRILGDNETSSLMLVTAPRALLRNAFETTFNAIFPATTAVFASSAAVDTRNRVYWRASCDYYSEWTTVERYTLSSDIFESAPLSPTHYSELSGQSCDLTFDSVVNPGLGGVDPVTRSVILLPTKTDVLIMKMFDCSLATSCDQCSLEHMYCSWCVSASGSSCVEKSVCQGDAQSVATSKCPFASSLSPSSVSSEGSTDVLLVGSNLATLEAELRPLGGIYCNVDSSLTKASVFSDSLLRCAINPISATGTLDFFLALNNSQSIDSVPQLQLPVYSCDTVDSCSDCANVNRRDCKWCAFDSVCKSRLASDSQCPTQGSPQVAFGNSATTCTLLTDITPSSIPTHFSGQAGIPQAVSIASAFPNVASGWTCHFDSTSVAGVLDFASQRLSCNIPSITLPPGIVELNIPVRVKLNGKFFAANALSLSYYDCDVPSTCGTCVASSRPFCGWCLDTVACMANTSASCTDFLPSASVCPNAVLAPLSTMGVALTPLTITGGPFLSGTSYFCNFTGDASGLIAATFVSASILTCDAPIASVTEHFDVQVDIVLNSRVYAKAGTLRYYTCSSVTCSACAHPLHTDCAWCVEESRCDTNAAMGVTCSSKVGPGFCPSVTAVSPIAGARLGGLNIALTGSGLGFSGTYECAFTGPKNGTFGAVQLFTSAAIQSATSATCTTPTIPTSEMGPYEVSIRYNDTGLGSNVLLSTAEFSFLDCRALSSCSSCLTVSQCSWCPIDGRCAYTGSNNGDCINNKVVSSASLCPVISSVSPLAAQRGVVTTVTITGEHLNDPDLSPFLRCQVDGVGQLQAHNTTAPGAATDIYTCKTNVLTPAGQQPFIFNLDVFTQYEYATYQDVNGSYYTFDVYDCSVLKTCDACAGSVSDVCGWCSVDSRCTSQAACSVVETWAQDRCPRVTALSRSSVDETAVGRQFEFFASHLDLLGPSTLSCSFSTPLFNVTTPVASVSPSDGRVTCDLGQSPSQALFEQASQTSSTSSSSAFAANAVVSLVHADNPSKRFTTNAADAFFDPNANLEYVKCQRGIVPTLSCHDYLSAKADQVNGITSDDEKVDFRCGWCVYDGFGGIASSCSSGYPLDAYQNTTSDCATVTDINPKEGPSTGATQITISGAGFIQSDRLLCQFGNLLSASVFVSTNAVTCITPERPDLQSGSASSDFALVLRKSYSSSGSKRALDPNEYVIFGIPSQPISFTYNYAANDKKSNLAWIAAPIIVALLVIVAAIIILVLLRKRFRERKLTPPDFNKYAFSANSKLIRDVPDTKHAALDELALLLSEDNYALGLALADVTTGADDDLLSRALIYAAYPNSFALDMLIKFIETEVADSEEEGELFRASSLACKMYTIYSKVVGVQYLWKTLARSIHTLDDAGQAEDRRQNSGSSSTTPPSTGQVSMMDLGTLEVDPERLADKLEKEVDSAVLTDVTIYQYELLLKTGRIFKKVMDSVNSVPRELRIAAKRVKALVSQKFTEREMDYKGVCAFFFLRFICPAVMTPQIYGVLEHPPGETSQRYFVLIAKTIQNLANGTLPSQKEAYMAKMDEFVIDNKDTLHRFIDTLCTVQDAGSSSDTLDDSSLHNARDVRLAVSNELYYSSLSFIHTHYMAHQADIQDTFKAKHEEEFAQRLHETMVAIGGGETKKPTKKPKKSHQPKASSSKA